MSLDNLTRKQILAGLVMLPALAATLSSAASAAPSKESVKFQETPKDGKQCSQCGWYGGNNEKGNCRYLKTEVPAKAWCEAYYKK